MTRDLDATQTGRTNPLDMFLGYQLRRASHMMLSDLAATIADLALTVTELSVVMVIGANPDITQSEIGRILSIKRANMAPLAAQLEQRGLVRRMATDGRAHALRLTGAGSVLAGECERRVALHERRCLQSFTRAEQLALLAQLRRVWQEEEPGAA